ncbi:ATP-binding cassette domain-containing protein [Kutzneria buriramensis]|uniref:ABC-2 type transport system ATP-binding protein/iron complex transport system ATP-binding protein n=1 Tax=Kutzneria buriramensis TaxID=1045776 RepID=A0A3E0HIA8_9PSEU|nr:ATP-binding cassette domain-containing protein [Kutzneria buriramensis]REH46090.1 ABC-2 type transport system ATP-binding protein/iron complex transport system ATP-binding protein [Kutzneria buriramensis]
MLRHVSVAVEPGSVVAVVGHNGAGKTTLVRVAVGLARPDGGEVHVAGIPLARLGVRAAARGEPTLSPAITRRLIDR